MESTTSNLLPRREVLYCAKCGMPPEFCKYGPDFESHCAPWLKQTHPDVFARLHPTTTAVVEKPSAPWTLEERLTKFYEKYQPDKMDAIPSLLEKYAGKEEKLFVALVQKYGPEPEDPFYAEEDDEPETVEGASTKRRGAGAKGDTVTRTRIVVTKTAQKKRKQLTIVSGMDTIPDLKLKDASKIFSKRFAGSSSVKENAKGEKEIILQGDHVYDVAEFIVDKFAVPESCVFVDVDGEVVPLR